MASKIIIISFYLTIINAFVIQNNDKAYPINDKLYPINDTYIMISDTDNGNPVNVFDGVYTECFSQFSYTCLQRKTLLYLKELNRLNEISVIGKYVTFVKLNNSDIIQDVEASDLQNTEELSLMIDKAVNNFFDSHLIRFRALGKDVIVPNEVEEFVGRKRRKGGGGGHGGGDGGKKKMMMMAMMCMKMKLMVMLPAMMGMMGMMSFKGMMFSMMSFMISKMMLLMKILEKKGGGGGGGGDGGWAAGGGGAWMPAGGQDYGGGGGYDANGQWQSRSIIEAPKLTSKEETPIVSYVKPTRYNNKVNGKPISLLKNLNDEVIKLDQMKPKSRRKRGIIDAIQNAYLYWASKFLGIGYKKNNYPKYKIFNGVKYVYYPVRSGVKVKTPKELPVIKTEESKPVVIADDFNEGEIVEGPVEGRMIRKKFHKMKDNVNETVDDNPWE